MAKYFLGFIFYLISFISFSQKFSTLYPGKDFLYKNAYWGIKENLANTCGAEGFVGLAIDSFKIAGNDTIFFHYNISRQSGDNPPDCYYQRYPNWAGGKTVAKNNGENIFLSQYGDSIRINTQAQVNDKWHLYDLANGDYFEAEVSSKIYGNVLSGFDSLKIINISFKDNVGNPLAHDFNGKQIVLSKNYGLVKTYDFSRFPKDTSVFILQGISNPEMGVQNLTAQDVYDFDIGDEFHIEENFTYIPFYGIFKKERRIVLSKTLSLNQDTVLYEIERIAITHNYNYEDYSHDSTAVKDTILEKYIFSELTDIDLIPYKIKEPGEGYPAFSNCMMVSGYNSRIQKEPKEFYNGDSDFCFDAMLLVYQPVFDYYLEGLGYYYDGDYYPGQNHKKLLYFKKGTETWGTPVNFDLLLSLQAHKQKIYSVVSPNPFADFTILKVDNSKSQRHGLVIMDTYGKVVNEYSFDGEQFVIQKGDMRKGLYFYKLTNHKNETGEGKLIVY